MKQVSKKFLQKLANKTGWTLSGVPLSIKAEYEGWWSYLKIFCPEFAWGEVIKPQEKWRYPVVTKETWDGGEVWCNMIEILEPWWCTMTPEFGSGRVYVLPDPNNPDKPPKKNWRPE